MAFADKKDIEAIKASEFFDEKWYLSQYPDVAMAGMDAAEHYLWLGWRLDRDPSLRFCSRSYLDHHHDVAKDRENPLLHYLMCGRKEGRSVLHSRLWSARLKEMQEHAERKQPWLVSIIMPAFNREGTIAQSIRSVVDQTYGRFELIIVDDGSTDRTCEIVESFSSDARIKLVKGSHRGVSAARNLGLTASSGELVAYLDSDNVWVPEYLATMVGYMSETGCDVAYSQIEIINDDGRLVRGDAYDRHRLLKGNFIDLNVYCHLRSLYESQGGFDEALRRMVDWDLIIRQTDKAQHVAHVPFVGCQYVNTTDDQNRISVKEFGAFRKVVIAKTQRQEGTRLEDYVKLNFAIKVPAPFEKREEWGDFHYADSLAGALNRLGHKVRIDFHGDWDKPNPLQDDVVIVIRGLDSYKPVLGQINILWNISHPDQVSFEEYESYDIAYVASLSYTDYLSAIGVRKVKPLLQATDVHRFNPKRKAPEKRPEALFVGNSRNVHRNMVKWSIGAGFNLTVFGTRWEQFIPKSYIGGLNIANRDLGGYYHSAAFVLNDHWASMKEFGLISNRIFDVLSAGGRVISDRMPAISYVFGDAVQQVDSQAELAEAARREWSVDVASMSQQIGSMHSFEARANTILGDVFSLLGMKPAAPSTPYVLRNKRLVVNGVVRQDREFPQSSSFIRLLCPLTTDAAYNEIDFKLVPARNAFESRRADISIVQRAAFDTQMEAQSFLSQVRASAGKLIVDNDDAFCYMDETHPEHDIYKPRIEALDLMLKNADANWVSTEVLREAYSHLPSQPIVMHNCIDPRLWRDYRRPTRIRNETPQLVYAGTATHDSDFDIIIEALDDVARQVSFNMTIIGAVRHPPEREWLTVLMPPKTAQSYPRFVRWFRQQGPFDIGVAPLASNKFNSAKSDLKLLDYGALGILPIASQGPSYTSTLGISKGGLIVENSTHAWAECLKDVVADVRKYDEKRDAAFEYAYSVRNVTNAYQSLRESILAI